MNELERTMLDALKYFGPVDQAELEQLLTARKIAHDQISVRAAINILLALRKIEIATGFSTEKYKVKS